MSFPPTTRLAGGALAAGGVTMSVAYFLKEVAPDSGTLLDVAVATNVLGVLLVMLGLPSWYAAQAHRVRIAGLVSFLVVFTGLPLLELTSSTFALVEASTGNDPWDATSGLLTTLFLYGIAGANLGLVAFGVCTVVANVLPRPAGLMVAVGPLLLLAPLPFPFAEPVALSIAFLGVAWLGWSIAGAATVSDTTNRASAMV
jgi:hypothetical protein